MQGLNKSSHLSAQSASFKSPFLTRRDFLKMAGAEILTASLESGAAYGQTSKCEKGNLGPLKKLYGQDAKTIITTCLGCNARCGLKCTVSGGRIKEITGNPYHPYNTGGNPLPYSTPPKKALSKRATTCAKAQEIDAYSHNPRRLLLPLKRAGKRGEGRFEVISWEQLIKEICQGGQLFKHLGEDRVVPGLKSLLSDELIRPDAPELGTKRNKFCFLTGRLQSGRKEFIDRFVKYAFGSINRIGHTDICGLGFRMGNFAFTDGHEVELKADPWNAKYILIFGANIYEALQPGLNTYGSILAKRAANGQVKFVIIDPRAQKAACHAHRWVKILPGQDGAFALGLIRWMIENNKYQRAYLEAPNVNAAQELGNGSFVNATHLIVCETGNELDGKYLRLHGDYAVIDKKTGKLVSYNETQQGELFVDKVITLENGEKIRVKSAFELLRQEAFKYTVDEYARFCGIEPQVIVEVAKEFAENAPFSATCQYHGAGNYVNGTYAAYAVAALNALSGSIGKKGGYLASGKGAGDWKTGIYDLSNFPSRKTPKGVRISREKATYQKSSFFKNKSPDSAYPAKRPWFPFTKGGLSVEALAGIDESYPYSIDCLFLYFFNPVYSIPGGKRFEATFKDPNKVPLLVSIDIGINESNVYADYIVPDITYAEGQYGWLSPHAPGFRFTSFRSPAIEPLTGKTNDGRPFCLETFLIDLALELNLPGFGTGVISTSNEPGSNKRFFDLKKAEDFYLRAYSNICFNAGIRSGDESCVEFVENNYPLARFKEMFSKEEWQALCYALARGGIFYPLTDCFNGECFKYGPKHLFLYNEKLASTACSLTGKSFFGGITYVPPIYEISNTYPFILVSYKDGLHTQSRTIWHPIALEIQPENLVHINTADARALGLTDGEKVLLSSPWNKEPLISRVKITSKVRPQVVALSISYGHRQLGAQDIFIKDGQKAILGGTEVYKNGRVVGDKRLGSGINPNELAALNSKLNNTPLVDPLGGIPDFSSTCIAIKKIS